MAGLKSIQDLRNRVATFNNGLSSGAYIQQIIWDNDAYIVDMNAEEQLFEQGINRLGVEIMDYAPYSEVGDKQFEIKASDFKTEDLIKKYGRQILGLTDENIAALIWQYIFPDLMKKAKNVLYGNE